MGEMEIVGARIRAMREHKGWTQGQLAYKARTTAAQISRIEHNERPGAQARLVASIAKALDTTVDYLMGLTGDPGIPERENNSSPESRLLGEELQKIWTEIEQVDPGAARELRRIAIVQAEAFRAAVNAAQRRPEQIEQEQ